MTETTIIRYRITLTARVRSRALSALARFFQYALEHKLAGVIYNPVYRARRASCEEMTLLDFMLASDIPKEQLKEIRWADVLSALGNSAGENLIRLKAGETIRLKPHIRHRLERELRRRLARNKSIRSLLQKRVAQ